MSVTNTDWTALQQAEDMAYFKADLCCYSPESYTLEEKKEICNDMMTASKALLDAMRADFEQLPPEFRSKLLDMLCRSEVESPEWWWDVLAGDGDPSIGSLRQSSAINLRRGRALGVVPGARFFWVISLN